MEQVHEVQPQEHEVDQPGSLRSLVGSRLILVCNLAFVLTPHLPSRNGHGCMLQYALLHLYGYALSIDDLKAFRVSLASDLASEGSGQSSNLGFTSVSMLTA